MNQLMFKNKYHNLNYQDKKECLLLEIMLFQLMQLINSGQFNHCEFILYFIFTLNRKYKKRCRKFTISKLNIIINERLII